MRSALPSHNPWPSPSKSVTSFMDDHYMWHCYNFYLSAKENKFWYCQLNLYFLKTSCYIFNEHFNWQSAKTNQIILLHLYFYIQKFDTQCYNIILLDYIRTQRYHWYEGISFSQTKWKSFRSKLQHICVD